MKSGGEWISSVDLENHIVGLDGVAQACVVGRPHPKWDERPIALVVKKPGSEVSAKQVIDHCAEQFAKWQLPDDVLFVEYDSADEHRQDGQEDRARASGFARLRTAGPAQGLTSVSVVLSNDSMFSDAFSCAMS